jgi:capsular exopolysaccharide synthesis family protein
MSNHDPSLDNSKVMYPSEQGNLELSHALIPAQPSAMPELPAMPGYGVGIPQGPEIIHGSFNQTWLLNCLRRRWLPAALLGVLSAALFGIALLWLFPLSSSVTAYLEVKGQNVSWEGQKEKMHPKELELFQETQKTWMKSQFVLQAALRPTAIAELETVRKEGEDALTWLYEGIQVNFRGEILEVRYDGEEDSEELKKVVESVINAYIQEVRETQRIEKREVVDKLANLSRELRVDLEAKIEDYGKLAKDLDGGDSPIAREMLNMLVGELRLIDTQIFKAKEELIDLEVGRKVSEQEINSPAAIDRAVQEQLEEDPMLKNLQEEQYLIAQNIRSQSNVGRGNSPALKQLQGRYQGLAQEIQRYRYQTGEELKESIRSLPNDQYRIMMTNYIATRTEVERSLAELETQKNEKIILVKQRGEKSGMLAMLLSEIEQLREISQAMEHRLRSSTIEDDTQKESIRIMQHAYAEEKINETQRYTIAALGGTGAFCATCYLVALIEFRKRRLNSPTDIDEGLGVRVLGVLPPIASRSAMRPGSPIAMQLSESIDNVRATLMHDSTSRSRQVVLVTSPATMEGTTTVASHLALSFTRAGRRTLLIDGDLREPALHKLFGMPVEDGFSEVLRSEIDIADAIRPTNTEGLWLLPAGLCDMDAIHALATDQLQPIFEKLRAEFDFIVIDAPPVLGLADTLSMGQHVDGVILTVLRDHSEVRKIYQATELLRDLGIRLLGSVVNGVPLTADRRIARLHQNMAARPKKLAEAVEK